MYKFVATHGKYMPTRCWIWDAFIIFGSSWIRIRNRQNKDIFRCSIIFFTGTRYVILITWQNIMLLFFPLSFYFISTNQYLYFFIHIVLATGEECSYTKWGGSTRFSKACQTTTGKEARLTRKKNVGFNKEISAKLCRHQIDLDIYINIFFW